jgi:hypothetical protein
MEQLARDENRKRRELVQRHPPVAAKLTALFADPCQWNGYLPPSMWGGKLNDSPRRAALMAIATEAQRHQTEGCDCEP